MTVDPADAPIFDRETIRTFQSDANRLESTPLSPTARRAIRQFGKPVLSTQLVSGLFRAGEFVLLVLTGAAVAIWDTTGISAWALWIGIILASLMTVCTAEVLHCYDPRKLRSRWQQVVRLAGALTLSSMIMTIAFSTLSESRATLWCAVFLPAALAVTVPARLVMGASIRRWNRNGVIERRVVLVGGGGAAETFIRQLEREPDSDIRICGIFDDRDDRRSPPIVAGYPKLGSIAELTEFVRLAHVDMLIVTLPLTAKRRILSILKSLWILPIDIRLAASSSSMEFRSRGSAVGHVAMLDVIDRPLAEWDVILKRLFDLVVGSVALAALSPVFVATAIAIKMDSPGPVFFRQKRHGFNNETINVWKFRSLRHDMADPTARKIVTRNDPRVTRVGRFIRRSSIDEMPQLFNVLTGELSLVGPRPHALHAVSSDNETFMELVDGYLGRHKVKPGVTGWAQVKGWRGEIDRGEKLQKRFEHDLYYIENWSLLLDIYILAITPISLLRPQGAY
ncbi:undecaprenyl-phosphate glucose phosphotransferase [Aureimonas sp. AU4]|uniref:undecaprenyl-phosphate glucose phosphotransferase n=1 Tax=Aureimonas sp. AU4 TaxID=1638163 RepID=UPI00078208E7|nr:undecaprenyl-phosphate glucose phosphotransferase [Aureimonas sp. AU4]